MDKLTAVTFMLATATKKKEKTSWKKKFLVRKKACNSSRR